MFEVEISPAYAGVNKVTGQHQETFIVETKETNDFKVLHWIQNKLKTGDIPHYIDKKTKKKDGRSYELRKTSYGYEYVLYSEYFCT